MTTATLGRIAGGLIVSAALTGAAMTAAEIITAPYNPLGTFLIWDGPVHLVKYLAMVTLLIALPAAFVVQRTSAGRLGFAGLVLILFGLGASGTPYNVLQMTLDPSLPVATLQATWDRLTNNALIGAIGSIGFLAIVIGIIVFALASRRAGGVMRSAATVSLISLGVAFAQLFVMDVLPALVPHPPTWLLLGLAAYGAAVWRHASAQVVVAERPGLVGEAARA
jgi:hypothetical protein